MSPVTPPRLVLPLRSWLVLSHVSVLVLPLYVPTLILGALAGNAAASGLDPSPYLMLSGAITLACSPLCPVVAAAGLRLALR